MKPRVLSIDTGPAGRAVASELIRDGRFQPIVLEASGGVDGISRIYLLRRYFDYPVSLSWTTVCNLGLWRMTRPGTERYLTFLKDCRAPRAGARPSSSSGPHEAGRAR